jgi:hypothetical protein
MQSPYVVGQVCMFICNGNGNCHYYILHTILLKALIMMMTMNSDIIAPPCVRIKLLLLLSIDSGGTGW